MATNDYRDIAEKYPLFEHAVYLTEAFHAWQERKGLSRDLIHIHPDLTKEVSKNLFVDLDRMADFHGIDQVNKKKFAAFQAAWLMRIRPIQIRTPVEKSVEQYVYANEFFTIFTIIAHMFDTSKDEKFLDVKHEHRWKMFLKRLIYHFHHRVSDGRSLELALEGLGTVAPYDDRKENGLPKSP